MSKNRYTWHEIENKLRDLIVDELGVDHSEVTLDAQFIKDLGADSLDTVEMLMRAEELFEVEILDETAEKMTTIAESIRAYIQDYPREALTLVDTKILAFRMRLDGSIEVSLHHEDGSWTYADGKTLLPSKLYLVTL